MQADECQLRAQRLYGRLAELRAKLFGEHIDVDSPESMAQIARIAGFLRGSMQMEERGPRVSVSRGGLSLARGRG